MPQGLIGGSRPDLTPAQLIAGIPIIAELLHTFGVYDLSQAQQDSLGKTVTFCFGLLGADAAVRIGRNLKDGRVEATALLKPDEAPVGPDYSGDTGEGSQEGVAVAAAEAPLDAEEISDAEYEDEGLDEELDLDEDPDLGGDPDLDEELGPIGDAEDPDDKEV